MFLDVLECLQQASLDCRLPALIVAGYLPPADATVELTTVTPDPAVVEINTAPSVDAESFLWRSREIYAAAADQGLAPYRLYFNGAVADSGGGGQITLGGPSPQPVPSCASRGCCRASFAFSTVILRCPTSSPTTSWAAADSRYGPTNAAPMPSTNWRLPLPC
jgi:uncharacterized protein (DUF2126 family)